MNVIRWSMKDTTGCVRRGKLPLSQLREVLLDFEKDAAEVLRKTDADHVLYAIKIYDASDNIDRKFGGGKESENHGKPEDC